MLKEESSCTKNEVKEFNKRKIIPEEKEKKEKKITIKEPFHFVKQMHKSYLIVYKSKILRRGTKHGAYVKR